MIAIIDYGAGNLQSVEKALRHIGCACQVASTPAQLALCEAAVLPGVGAFGEAMAGLSSRMLDTAVREFIGQGRPLLGICRARSCACRQRGRRSRILAGILWLWSAPAGCCRAWRQSLTSILCTPTMCRLRGTWSLLRPSTEPTFTRQWSGGIWRRASSIRKRAGAPACVF